MGILLSKELMSIAGHSLKANITTLGPLVLPISEQLLFFVNLIARKVRSSDANAFVSAPLATQPDRAGVDGAEHSVSAFKYEVANAGDGLISRARSMGMGSLQKMWKHGVPQRLW